MKNLMHQEIYDDVLSSLLAYENAGVKITNSGSPSSPRDIAYACSVREGNGYMLDYIPDNDGRIYEIRFEDLGGPDSRKPIQKKYYKII